MSAPAYRGVQGEDPVFRAYVDIVDETMREGMQIESLAIATGDKIRLLNALSQTGIRTIVVGSFVSPRWTPQMSDVDEVVKGFNPKPGVEYRALALNARGAERRAQFEPPLSPPRGADRHMLRVHLCPVFVRRNTNRLPEDEIRGWPEIVARAVREGAAEAGISVNAAWGSNFTGAFDLRQRMSRLEQQYCQWQAAGIPVRKVWLGDPMGWNSPWAVAEQIGQITRTWPEIRDFHLHLHDTRGLAMSSAAAAAQALTESHRLILDTSLGGVGGCPYCGNGRATGMIPTEDLAHMLEFAGIDTGIDLARLIDASVLAEQILGRRLHSRITHAGPAPALGEYFAEDLGIVETFEEAAHFRLGPKVIRRALPNLPARH